MKSLIKHSYIYMPLLISKEEKLEVNSMAKASILEEVDGNTA